MAGDVWEWTLSNHESGGKVVRGGSWRNGAGSLKTSDRINSLLIYTIDLLISFSFINMGSSSIKHICRFHQGFG